MFVRFKNLFKPRQDIIFIFLVILFFILVVWLCVDVSSNISFLVTPITLILGLWLWKKQELTKRRADAAEEMYKAFHLYAIQIVHVHFRIISKLKKTDHDLNQEQISVLNTEYEKVMELQGKYFVARESFYRVADISEDIKRKIDKKFAPFFYVVIKVEDILDDPNKNNIKSFNLNKDLNSQTYVEDAGNEIKELVQPYIQFIKF